MVSVNQLKELESEGPILEGIGLKDPPNMVEVQIFEPVTRVNMYYQVEQMWVQQVEQVDMIVQPHVAGWVEWAATGKHSF